MKNFFLSLLLLGGLVACASREPLPQYYVLSNLVGPQTTALRSGRTQVYIRQVIIPPYLIRRNLVSMSANNMITYSKTGLWAESVDSAIGRAIAADLSRRGVGTVSFQPGTPVPNRTRDVLVQISRFEGQSNGDVVLLAKWGVTTPAVIAPDLTHAALIKRSGWTPGDDAGMAALLTSAVDELTAKIRATL